MYLTNYKINMNKFFKAIIALTLIISIGIPYGISMLLKREYYNLINRLNTPLQGVEISGEFTTGWFTSKAKTHIKTKANNPINLSLELEHSIKNGPMIVDVDKHAVRAYKLAIVDTKISNQQFIALNNAIYAGKEGLEIVTEVEYDGTLITKVKNLPVTQNTGTGQIEWGGMEATIRNNRKFTYLKNEIIMPKLVYREVDNILEVQMMTITGEGKQKLATLGLWDGSGEFNLKQFGIKSGTEEVFTVDGCKYSVVTGVNDTIVNFNVKLSINNIFEFASNNKIGPLVLGLSINNIDGEALHKMHELGFAMTNTPVTVDKMNELWRSILLKRPEIKIKNTEFNLPQGKLVVDAEAKIGGQDITQINKPVLLKTIDAVVKIEITKALAYELVAKKIEHDILLEAKDFDLSHEGQKMPKPYKLTLDGKKAEIEKRVLEEVTKLIGEKFLIEKEKTFTSEIIMKNGVMTVNGKELQWDL